MSINESTVLDDAVADLFDLDPQTEIAADLVGADRSADCTNNGCTNTCQTC